MEDVLVHIRTALAGLRVVRRGDAMLRYSMVLAAIATCALACQPALPQLTDEQRAAIRDTVEQVMARMADAGRALDADRIRAVYAESPVSVINGVIIEDFDARFELTRQFIGSLRTLDGSYRNVHLEVLGSDVVVVTRNDDIAWSDTTGVEGVFHTAWTGVIRRIDGEWKIAYSHESWPLPDRM
jgi:ketosteroid isomerase-like protein